MKTLDHYLKLFSRLRRASGAVWGAATKKKASHKPILLLAVMGIYLLAKRGQGESPRKSEGSYSWEDGLLRRVMIRTSD